jgi:hypothetical protein
MHVAQKSPRASPTASPQWLGSNNTCFASRNQPPLATVQAATRSCHHQLLLSRLQCALRNDASVQRLCKATDCVAVLPVALT